MMQEVANDSNGESTYDLLADAKKEVPSSSSASSFPPPFPNIPSGLTVPPAAPVYSLPSQIVHSTASLSLTQKPSYEFPPGAPQTSGLNPGHNTNLGLQSQLRGPPPVPFSSLSTPQPSRSSDVSDFINAAAKLPSASPNNQQNVPAGPDLNEIFGRDVMAKLPPLQPARNAPLPMSLVAGTPAANPTSFTPTSVSVFPSMQSTSFTPVTANNQSSNQSANIQTMPGQQMYANPNSAGGMTTQSPGFALPRSSMPAPPIGGSASGVNPYSSKAAAAHLPSFSGLPPLPGHLQQGRENIPLPAPAFTGFSIPQSSRPAVSSSVPLLPVSAGNQQFSGPSTSFVPPPPPPPMMIAPVDPQTGLAYGGGGYSGSAPSYGQSDPGVAMQMGAPSLGSSYYDSRVQQNQDGHLGNRSWWAQTSLDTFKNISEKAKSTVFSLMTTLDPQMKQYGTSESTIGGDLVLFYIGNEVDNTVDAVKSGFDPLFRSVHIYTRSGTAPGHKMQSSFAGALAVATETLNLARSAPQLQSSVLVSVEPFLVELIPGSWYVSICLVLQDVSKGALLHSFTQLTQLPQGLNLNLSSGQNLPSPMDELISNAAPMSDRGLWMELISGVSWASAVASGVRQLAGVYKRRYPSSS